MDSVKIEKCAVAAYKIPTSQVESDGTLEWDATTLVTVSLFAGGVEGFGYTYADKSTAVLAHHLLETVVARQDALRISDIWNQMVRETRNLGREGITSMAISAVDNCLWDLKSKLLKIPLVSLLGRVRESALLYGSGGFTSYDQKELEDQLRGWAHEGLKAVKMKIGTFPEKDLGRVAAARKAVGGHVGLFVDANGAYSQKQAVEKAREFADYNVAWFEEPVPARDFDGTQFVRAHSPSKMQIASGEYGYDLNYFRRMLEKKAVDFLQADVTRCGGFTGFQQVAALAQAFEIPLSSHCAPTLHIPLGCSILGMEHIEYFYDHVRIEKMLFDGWQDPIHGRLAPRENEAGLGIKFKFKEAEKFLI